MGGESAVPCRHGEQTAAVLAHPRDADQPRPVPDPGRMEVRRPIHRAGRHRRRRARRSSALVRAGHRAGGPGSEGRGTHPPPARRPLARTRSTRLVDRHGHRRRAASTCLKPAHRCRRSTRPRRRRPSHPQQQRSDVQACAGVDREPLIDVVLVAGRKALSVLLEPVEQLDGGADVMPSGGGLSSGEMLAAGAPSETSCSSRDGRTPVETRAARKYDAAFESGRLSSRRGRVRNGEGARCCRTGCSSGVRPGSCGSRWCRAGRLECGRRRASNARR